MKHLSPPQRVAQNFHFTILRIEVTRASRGLSAIAELLVWFLFVIKDCLCYAAVHDCYEAIKLMISFLLSSLIVLISL